MNSDFPSHPLPPTIPGPNLAATSSPGLPDRPEDREPLAGGMAVVEAVLRQPHRLIHNLHQPGAGRLVLALTIFSAIFALVYGLVIGTFSMGPQLWAAPVKMAIGLLVSALICFPSLYIFTCLSGSQVRLTAVAGLLAGLVMVMTLLLIGFAPVAWLFSQSTESVSWMGALHLLFWSIATLFGVRFLRAGFARAGTTSSAGINTWAIIFVLVALQMTTALRPLLGVSDTFLPTEKRFFLTHWATTMSDEARQRRSPMAPNPDPAIRQGQRSGL